jgi:nicotinamidase-related amidase
VEKSRASGFVNTPLDLILRSNGIRTVVVTGESSYGCVLNTVMDASCYDYYTVVVEDLIAGPNQDLHEAALKLMRPRHDVLKSAEILEVWGASGH